MNQSTVNLHKLSTQRVIATVKELSEEQWFTQPAGFANNIAWNVGHIWIVRQRIIYGRSELEIGLPESYAAMYNGGTSPADWESNPDPAELIKTGEQLMAQLETDAAENKFTNFGGLEIGGIPMPDIDTGAMFNLWHEGLHLGQMAGLLDAMKG